MALSKRAVDRIISQLKKYQSILADARDRDISESDTVVIIGDMLADILGYKKYTEITTEYAIRGTFVDLAVQVNDEARFLLEAKAIGVTLKDQHVKQAMEYGAHKGIEWIVLTNGVVWRVYKVHFRQPIDQTLVFELDLLQPGIKTQQLVDCFGILSREGFTQSSMTAFYQHQQITGKYTLAALLLSPALLTAMRKEIRRIDPRIKVDEEYLKTVMMGDIIKRDLVDSEEGKQSAEFLKKAEKAAARAKAKKASLVVSE
jgi:hypothetical protein